MKTKRQTELAPHDDRLDELCQSLPGRTRCWMEPNGMCHKDLWSRSQFCTLLLLIGPSPAPAVRQERP